VIKMDINLIKSFIEKSDFDENIILNTDINASLEKSIFNHIDEAINLIKKLDKFIDNQDFSNILKELSKKFLLIKDKKNVSFETKNIENCILKYSNILSLNDEYKTPEENEEVLIAYLLYIIIKKIQRRFLLLSKSRRIKCIKTSLKSWQSFCTSGIRCKPSGSRCTCNLKRNSSS